MMTKIDSDRALAPGSALKNDQLGRAGFARAAVKALIGASRTSGFVLSIEGEWGSGKTSALALIEELLAEEADKPVVVHFNPWLIGDRDALIRLFFEGMSKKVKVSDHGADAKRAAKAIKNYAKVFDALKLIPGAYAIADLTKNVMVNVADAAEGYGTEKELDLEGRKRKLSDALAMLESRILVFIDDVDRLLPGEVIEIVRIIKAVGDFPNVGYVVAWDSDYVTRALATANIPKAAHYLDKIVQVRLPLPAISEGVRQRLLQQAVDELSLEARSPYFPQAEERMRGMYMYGLRHLLAQPRDIVRMMNTLSVIEPTLRGEIVLADLLGLACLMTKAPSVYEHLRRDPLMFQGRTSRYEHFSDSVARKKHFMKLSDRLWADLDNASAVKELVHYMFPAFASACGELVLRADGPEWGTLAEPDRLALALAFDLGGSDVSLVAARQYIAQPDQRPVIAAGLQGDVVVDFLEALGNLGSTIDTPSFRGSVPQLALDMARLVDSPSLADRLSRRAGLSVADAEGTASIAIAKIAFAEGDADLLRLVQDSISRDRECLTFRAGMINDSLSSRLSDRVLTLPTEMMKGAVSRLSEDSVRKLEEGGFWNICNPSRVLWTIMRNASKSACRRVFKALQNDDPSLDKFALAFFRHSFSSNGGQSYALPDEKLVQKLVAVSNLRAHARRRLADSRVVYPLRAAWQSVAEGRCILGKDGSLVTI